MTNLPALTGSEKQIAWASSIRETAINAIAAKCAELGLSFNPEQQQVYDWLVSQTSASFWIDNRARGDYAGGWLEMAARAVRASKSA